MANGVDGVKRGDWQKLAEERVKDAKVLLDGGQWAAAYYLNSLAEFRDAPGHAASVRA